MSANIGVPEVNLLAAWAGVLLGVLDGMVMGMLFHREDWLGGYGSFQRRMYRLGHISFFGLAVLNFMFFFTAFFLELGFWQHVAAWGFVLGAAAMPIACLLTAHVPRARPLFAIPVLSLILATTLTVGAVWDRVDDKPIAALGRYPEISAAAANRVLAEAWE